MTVITRLLEEDEDDDAILPSTPSRPGSVLSEGSPALAQVELNLLEMCWRVAAKLSIVWPSQQEARVRGETYMTASVCRPVALAVKQVIPAVVACVSEIKHFWDKPFSQRVPARHGGARDVKSPLSWRRWRDKWMLGHQTQTSGKRSALLQIST